MPTAKDRELVTVSVKAHKHLKNIVDALRNKGIPTTMTGYASELILSQPIPSNGHKPAPVEASREEE